MGVLSGKDLYSSKYITAEITDSASRIHIIPIKYTIGDYFLADIDGVVYAFKIDGSRIKTWYATLTKSFRKLYYDIDHFMPVSAPDNKAIADVLKDNGLPKMNRTLFDIMKYLGKRERVDFEAHDLAILKENVKEYKDVYKVNVKNMVNYLEHLNVNQIVTPVRKITEFIQEDLIATNPKFLGETFQQSLMLETEHKKVTNTPIRAKTAWMKWIAILMGVSLCIVVIVWAIQSGMFNHILPDFSNIKPISFQPPTHGATGDVMSQYKTPTDLKIAIDQGKVDYNSLPASVKKMVDTVKLPTATPIP